MDETQLYDLLTIAIISSNSTYKIKKLNELFAGFAHPCSHRQCGPLNCPNYFQLWCFSLLSISVFSASPDPTAALSPSPEYRRMLINTIMWMLPSACKCTNTNRRLTWRHYDTRKHK